MADDTSNQDLSFKLDLDNSDFLSSVGDSISSIKQLGDSSSLEGLLSGLAGVGVVLGTIGVAALALNESMDMVFDAERIQQVNDQFELLSKNAGISADDLKNGLEKSSGGLLSTTDLLKAANKGLVELGVSAKQLPQIMELARQATVVFGGDLTTNFDNINQAIATGNVRLLRHLGIVVDQKAAYDKFAASIGITADELSQQGKQQAVLNAILEKGNAEFKGVNLNSTEAINLWQQSKVAAKEFGESIALAFNAIAGPAIVTFLKGLSTISKVMREDLPQAAGVFKDSVMAVFGVGDQRLRGAIGLWQRLKAMVTGAKEAINQKEEAPPESMKPSQFFDDKALKAREEAEKTTNNNIFVNQEVVNAKRKKAEEDLEASIEALKKERLTREEADMKTEEDVALVHAVRRQAIENDFSDRRKEFEKEVGAAGVKTTEEITKARLEIEKEHYSKLRALDLQMEDDRIAAAKKFASEANNVSQGFERGWHVASLQAQKDAHNFGDLGAKAFKSVNDNAVKAFEDMGSGAKNAGDAMKEFILGSIGDQAEAQGQMMLLAGIWPPNPAAIAAGGALIALGAALKGASGGGGTTGGAGIPGGAAGGGGLAAPGLTTPSAPTTAPTTPTATTQIVVQGNIMDTDATRTRLMELMRQANDQQNYRLLPIGQQS